MPACSGRIHIPRGLRCAQPTLQSSRSSVVVGKHENELPEPASSAVTRALEKITACEQAMAAFHLCATFPRAREGGASASGFDPAAPARSYGDCSADSRPLVITFG